MKVSYVLVELSVEVWQEMSKTVEYSLWSLSSILSVSWPQRPHVPGVYHLAGISNMLCLRNQDTFHVEIHGVWESPW